ncbi:hypothetical protein AXF42_Ash014872 [Apostasia shenzhenica]|uniref:Uncharacterized protein n=1 Tax=Apostasia shenzhenica TaxID=1088818 RepID=A0A2I0ALD0_9ASPA|nr:hypothetical protein AXF42_Ash014872 [Apostasia shenzhenica]
MDSTSYSYHLLLLSQAAVISLLLCASMATTSRAQPHPYETLTSKQMAIIANSAITVHNRGRRLHLLSLIGALNGSRQTIDNIYGFVMYRVVVLLSEWHDGEYSTGYFLAELAFMVYDGANRIISEKYPVAADIIGRNVEYRLIWRI